MTLAERKKKKGVRVLEIARVVRRTGWGLFREQAAAFPRGKKFEDLRRGDGSRTSYAEPHPTSGWVINHKFSDAQVGAGRKL